MHFARFVARKVRALSAGSGWSLPSRHTRQQRYLTTLAIETSCDDTSVAVLTKNVDSSPDQLNAAQRPLAHLHFHKRITSNNTLYRGIHPLTAVESHERTLSGLIREALTHIRAIGPAPPRTSNGTTASPNPQAYPPASTKSASEPLDFISVTRGPGMRASLNAGLNTAKGLAVALGIPLVGVHHMQAHALTPRLVSALASTRDAAKTQPSFPFLTLLVSGGHTLLLESKGLTDHPILATTADIAVGDCVDKIARDVLPEEMIAASQSAMYGPLLERFAFPDAPAVNAADHGARVRPETYGYEAPPSRSAELARHVTRYGWSFAPPLAQAKAGRKSRSMEFSFTGLVSTAKRIAEARVADGGFGEEERRVMAREAMRVAFEHLAGRVVLALGTIRAECREEAQKVGTLVVSGGVAANGYLRAILRAFLDAKGYSDVELVFPPLDLCTDNAAMIGWAGIEMFEVGWESDLSCQSLKKWSLDPAGPDGGILGVPDWKRHGGIGSHRSIGYNHVVSTNRFEC